MKGRNHDLDLTQFNTSKTTHSKKKIAKLHKQKTSTPFKWHLAIDDSPSPDYRKGIIWNLISGSYDPYKSKTEATQWTTKEQIMTKWTEISILTHYGGDQISSEALGEIPTEMLAHPSVSMNT